MKHIAFRKIIGDENSEVFVADGDGSNPRNLTNNPFFKTAGQRGPLMAGRSRLPRMRGHGYQIFVMDADV